MMEVNKEMIDYCNNDIKNTNMAYMINEINRVEQKINLMFEVLIQLDETVNRFDYDRRLAKAEDEARRANQEVEYLRHDRDYVWKRTSDLRDHMRDIDRSTRVEEVR